jgi:tetratricopeptide (TPR) repeat protein
MSNWPPVVPAIPPDHQQLLELLAREAPDLSSGELPEQPLVLCDVPRTEHQRQALQLRPPHDLPFADWPDELEPWNPEWLITWGIFNPFGPTVNRVILQQVPESDAQLLVHRMRNPFRSEAAVYGRLPFVPPPADGLSTTWGDADPRLVHMLLTQLFERNGHPRSPLLACLPDYAWMHGLAFFAFHDRIGHPDPEIDDHLAASLFRSAYLRAREDDLTSTSVAERCAKLLEFRGNPWGGATDDFGEVLSALSAITEGTDRSLGELAEDPNFDVDARLERWRAERKRAQDSPEDADLLGLWFSLASDEDHATHTEEAIKEAWLGSQRVVEHDLIDEFKAAYSWPREPYPGTALDHAQLGILLSTLGRSEDAEAHERRAVELDPDEACYRYNLGLTLIDLDNAAEAARHLETASRLKPDEADVWAYLGLARVMARDEEGMRAALHKLVAVDPDYFKEENLSLHAHFLRAWEQHAPEAERVGQ